jgi:hypothetical protein
MYRRLRLPSTTNSSTTRSRRLNTAHTMPPALSKDTPAHRHHMRQRTRHKSTTHTHTHTHTTHTHTHTQTHTQTHTHTHTGTSLPAASDHIQSAAPAAYHAHEQRVWRRHWCRGHPYLFSTIPSSCCVCSKCRARAGRGTCATSAGRE